MNGILQPVVTVVVLLGITGMAAVEVFYRFVLSRSDRRRSVRVGAPASEETL